MEKPDDLFDKEIAQMVDSFMNRPKYDELTVQIIDSIKDDDLVLAIMDNLWAKMRKDMSDDFEVISSLSRERQAIYSTYIVEGEVNNGGFNQFYFNSSGQYADMAVDGFELLEARKFCDLMKKANDTYLSEFNKITEKQDGTIEGFSQSYQENPLNQYDDEFYTLNEVEEIGNLQVQFIRKNKASFVDK